MRQSGLSSTGRFLLFIFAVLALSIFVSNPQESQAEDPDELVFVFQKQKNPNELKIAADKVAKSLSTKLKIPVQVKVPSNYSASVQALVSKTADFAYTSSLPFLLARRDGDAEMILVEQRTDSSGKKRTEYDSVFVVKKDSPLKDVSDLVKNASDLRVVFTSPTSTSGYVFANSRLVDEGLLESRQDPKSVFKSVSFGGSYTKAVEEVLAGRGDVAAVSFYVVEGPRASKYLSPESLSNLRVLARTSGVPTHLISARAGLSPKLKSRVRKALIEISKETPELLEDVYGTASFVEAKEEEHVAKTVLAVKRLNVTVGDLVQVKK